MTFVLSRIARPGIGLVAAILAPSLAHAQSAVGFDQPTIDFLTAREGPRPVPAGARASLEFANGTTFTLGQPIDLTFVLLNAGSAPFVILTGGDYRGTGFPARYKFTVADETGTALRGEILMDEGGLAGYREVKVLESYREPLRLQNYVQIDRTGTFTVRVVHDFGWQAGNPRGLPVAEATIKVVAPSPAVAARMVQEISAQAPLAENFRPAVYGTRSPFSYLADPVFLSPLEQAAASGRVDALEGIGRIRTMDATRTLVRLLTNEDMAVRFSAVAFLIRRMSAGPERFRTDWLTSPEESEVFQTLWLPEAAQPLRAAGASLLRSSNPSYIRTGAFVFEGIGVPGDGPVLLDALATTLKAEWPVGPRTGIGYPEAGGELVEALYVLRKRGYRAPAGDSAEVAMAQVLEIADPAIPRRAGWEGILEKALAAGPPMLRRAGVYAIPEPIDGRWVPLLATALKDSDRSVLLSAVQVAGRSANPVFVPALASILRQESDRSILDESGNVLVKLGAQVEAVDAWIERITDMNLRFQALGFLGQKLEHPKSGGWSSSGPGRESWEIIRKKWRTFVADPERRVLLQAGRPLPIADDQARELFNGAFRIHLEGGGDWPPNP